MPSVQSVPYAKLENYLRNSSLRAEQYATAIDLGRAADLKEFGLKMGNRGGNHHTIPLARMHAGGVRCWRFDTAAGPCGIGPGLQSDNIPPISTRPIRVFRPRAGGGQDAPWLSPARHPLSPSASASPWRGNRCALLSMGPLGAQTASRVVEHHKRCFLIESDECRQHECRHPRCVNYASRVGTAASIATIWRPSRAAHIRALGTDRQQAPTLRPPTECSGECGQPSLPASESGNRSAR